MDRVHPVLPMKSNQIRSYHSSGIGSDQMRHLVVYVVAGGREMRVPCSHSRGWDGMGIESCPRQQQQKRYQKRISGSACTFVGLSSHLIPPPVDVSVHKPATHQKPSVPSTSTASKMDVLSECGGVEGVEENLISNYIIAVTIMK